LDVRLRVGRVLIWYVTCIYFYPFCGAEVREWSKNCFVYVAWVVASVQSLVVGMKRVSILSIETRIHSYIICHVTSLDLMTRWKLMKLLDGF
jgi:hypothetical protein